MVDIKRQIPSEPVEANASLPHSARKWLKKQSEIIFSIGETYENRLGDALLIEVGRLGTNRPDYKSRRATYDYISSASTFLHGLHQENLLSYNKAIQDQVEDHRSFCERNYPAFCDIICKIDNDNVLYCVNKFKQSARQIFDQRLNSFLKSTEYYINTKETELLNIRLFELISYADKHLLEPDKSLSFIQKCSEIFPEADLSTAQGIFSIRTRPLSKAPEELRHGDYKSDSKPTVLWKDRDTGENPVAFIRKHYGKWNSGVWDRGELTKPILRQTDFKLYEALAAWERRHPDDQLNLPTGKVENDKWVERVGRGEMTPAVRPKGYAPLSCRR